MSCQIRALLAVGFGALLAVSAAFAQQRAEPEATGGVPAKEAVRASNHMAAAANPLALPVKRADLEDNLQQALASGGDAERYRHGLDLLEKAGRLPA